MVFEDKHNVFIVSAGRTGTKYFGTILSGLIEDSFSVHEPDVFSGLKDPHLKSKLRDFGFYNLILGKFFRATGIRNLSENYLGNRLSLKSLKSKLVSHRKKYYSHIAENLVIESYYGWYGCLDAVPELYANYRILGVVRHPATWVVSNMNWQQWYGDKDRVTKFGAGRINPAIVRDKEYEPKWQSFTRFQKLCWAYKTIYEYIYEQSQQQENMLLVKFEDIFDPAEGHAHIRQVLDFITQFDDRTFAYDFNAPVINQQIHKNTSTKFPSYPDWTAEQKEQYHEICGNIEAKLNYS